MSATTTPPIPAIPDKLYFRIGDVAEIVGVKAYVLRYWETEFPVLSPEKTTSGQRVYRRSDVEALLLIKHLLYKERYSIEGARRRIRELKKDGELRAFQRENVLGGEQALSHREKLAGLREVALELQALLRTPLAEIFKV